MSAQLAAATPVPRDETSQTASLLAFIGGYLEVYTWIVHYVFANAQSANLVFLWGYMTGAEWERAARYIPPLLAFVVGVPFAGPVFSERCASPSVWAPPLVRL